MALALPKPKPKVQSALPCEIITQYPGPEQIELKVPNLIPGSWFGKGSAGTLSGAEKSTLYKATPLEYEHSRNFGVGQRKRVEGAIRFVCESDAADDANHPGFWIELKQWNRYRHYAFADRRDEEKRLYVPKPAAIVLDSVDATVQCAAAEAPGIKDADVFTFVSHGTHSSKKGIKQKCCFWKCMQPDCKGVMIKQIGKSTGSLFKHLKTCNPEKWLQLRLKSAHSKATVRPPRACPAD